MLTETPTNPWLNLNAAARYLGVHPTTLRRWADQGDLPCLRTPGGHRRFARNDLDAFLANGRNALILLPANGLTTRAVDHARTEIQTQAAAREQWYAHIDENWRAYFRMTGQRFMGLLMQYLMRRNGGEAFVEEGLRLATQYGDNCLRAGLTISETVRAFLFFRRSITDSIHEAGAMAGVMDVEGQRLIERMIHYMDTMLIATIEGYCQTQTQIAGEQTPS